MLNRCQIPLPNARPVEIVKKNPVILEKSRFHKMLTVFNIDTL